ncbi:hypothetical protein L249_8301 [Ophiocordyceps polyrhachis-furcata BCC 54312]|uniref:Uncharacterized protein n=1 Tax=Ophiocordyceps polyrhachis-furcata BCC 54312 TaxID=1330021 RepID=A0A367LHR3_9HYPO|nr:hypothetical protein L249_8301 [Ophiocordyceps polyrhachis-furcata BCC 54312]
MDSLGPRINPSLVSFMVAGNGAAEHDEAPVSTTPTPSDRLAALPLVIEGDADVDGFQKTPALSHNRARDFIARDFIDRVDTVLHGNFNSPASQLPPYPTVPLFGELLNPVVADEPGLSNCTPYMAWQQHNTTAHLVSPSPVAVPSVPPALGFPFLPCSFPDLPYDILPFAGHGWDASATWSPTSTPTQAVYEQRHGGAQATLGSYGRTNSSLRPNAQAFTPYSPTMTQPSTEVARQLLMSDPVQRPAMGGPSIGSLAGTLPARGMMLQPFYSQGPSMASYNPSETGSSHSHSTYISQPSSRSLGAPRYAATSMAKTNSTQSNRPLLPKHKATRFRQPPTPSLRSEDTNASPRPVDSFSSSGPRGKRYRSLSPNVRQSAKDRRDNRSVCVRCKLSSTACRPVEGASWCQKCQDQGTTSSCTVFYFMNMAESTRFTGIENHSISLPLLRDGKWRVIDFGQLLKHIERLGRPTVIRAVRDKQRLYDLDLGHCHRYLTEASNNLPPSYSIQSFVREQQEKQDWQTCVRIGNGFSKDAIGALAIFDDRPSETTFRLVHSHNRTERSFNPDNDHDRLGLLVAHVLSLTFGRQIEQAALAQLSRLLPKHQHMSYQELDFLAEQLLTIRWGVSLDFRRRAMLSLQPPSPSREAEMIRLEKRMKTDKTLCHKLYMCFCCLRHKREKRPLSAEGLLSFGDRTRRYAGTERAVAERLPKTDSWEAFEAWMADGRVAVEAAGVLERGGARGVRSLTPTG